MTVTPAPFAECARQTTKEILDRMGIPAVVSVKDVEGTTRVTIHAHESGLLIGKQGTTLNALQLIVGLIANRTAVEKGKVVLDTEGYRNRRQAALEETALRVADKAIATGRILVIYTMSSHERRIIHLALLEVPGVTTESEGEGAARHLLVIPVKLAADQSNRSSYEIIEPDDCFND